MAADWHPEDIKAALKKRYGTLSKLATAWGYTHVSLSTAIRNAGHSSRVELLIAEALGRKPHEIWPSRWTTDGYPARLMQGGPRGRRATKNGRRRPKTQRENGASA